MRPPHEIAKDLELKARSFGPGNVSPVLLREAAEALREQEPSVRVCGGNHAVRHLESDGCPYCRADDAVSACREVIAILEPLSATYAVSDPRFPVFDALAAARKGIGEEEKRPGCDCEATRHFYWLHEEGCALGEES
jgi:hypothetical protein